MFTGLGLIQEKERQLPCVRLCDTTKLSERCKIQRIVQTDFFIGEKVVLKQYVVLNGQSVQLI